MYCNLMKIVVQIAIVDILNKRERQGNNESCRPFIFMAPREWCRKSHDKMAVLGVARLAAIVQHILCICGTLFIDYKLVDFLKADPA